LVAKWNPNVNPNCELCSVKDNIQHLIYDCQLAQYLWQKVGNSLNCNIKLVDIIFGTENSTNNYIFSFICYLLFKFWCIENNNNPRQRNKTKLLHIAKSEFSFKIALLKYQIISEELVITLQNIQNQFL